MVTVAPGTTAPLESKTVPCSEVTSDCGIRNALKVKTNTSSPANDREADCIGLPTQVAQSGSLLLA